MASQGGEDGRGGAAEGAECGNSAAETVEGHDGCEGSRESETVFMFLTRTYLTDNLVFFRSSPRLPRRPSLSRRNPHPNPQPLNPPKLSGPARSSFTLRPRILLTGSARPPPCTPARSSSPPPPSAASHTRGPSLCVRVRSYGVFQSARLEIAGSARCGTTTRMRTTKRRCTTSSLDGAGAQRQSSSLC